MDPLDARALYYSAEPPYGFELPLLWGESYSGPAMSADNSVESDATDVLEAYLSKARRNRKQTCPQRAPMYGNTGAATSDTEDYHRHHSCDRSHRPSRVQRHPVSHFAAAATAGATAGSCKIVRATHSGPPAVGRGSSGGNTKKSANPCAGPCDNCGARESPQWRHGSKSKPIVCNACGIRFLRTGCFDKAVDKKRSGATSSAMSGGARQPKRSQADDCSSMEEDANEEEPHMASRSCARPAATDGGIYSCADSKAAAAGPAGSRHECTPSPEDSCGGCVSMDQQQQQAGGSNAVSPAMSSVSAYSDGAAPTPLNLGPSAVPNSTGTPSRSRAVTSANNSNRGGQQAGQLRGVVRGPNGRFVSRHGMSPLSVASSGNCAIKPSRFSAAAKTCVTASRFQPAATAGATGPVVPGSGARMPGGESRQPSAAPAAVAAAVSVPAVSPVVQLMMNLVGNLGSAEAAVEFIQQQVTSKSGAGGANLGAAAAVIAAVAAGATISADSAGPAAAPTASADDGLGDACARPTSAGETGV